MSFLPAGFSHKTSTQNIDLNCVRLAFQVFLEGNEKGAFTFALKPVVSDPIYDRSKLIEIIWETFISSPGKNSQPCLQIIFAKLGAALLPGSKSGKIFT